MVAYNYINESGAKKLLSEIDDINDYTTGINLIHGSRDFRTGVIQANGYQGNRYIDGFNNQGKFELYKDKEGFTVAHTISSGYTTIDNVKYLDSTIQNVKPNQVFTVSFEMMVDNISEFDDHLVFMTNGLTTENSNFWSTGHNYESGTSDILNNKEWKQIVFHLTAPAQVPDENIVLFRLVLRKNGSIHFRKLMIQTGYINNPIYAPNPNDIEYTNDITTMPNLLTGTREIRLGRSNQIGQVYTDGFRMDGNNIWSIKNREDGFCCIRANRTTVGTSNSYFRSSYFENSGETIYTVSGELDVETFYRESAAFVRMVGLNESGVEIGNVAATYAQIGFSASDVGKPYKFKHVFDISSISSAKYFYIDFQFPAAAIATYSIWKLALYPGNINHPEWGDNPLDITFINDETTGINLLRGTRDFTEGTIDASYQDSSLIRHIYTNGFSTYAFEKQIDDDGFTVLHIDRSGLTANDVALCVSNLIPIEANESITVSFEVKTDDLDAITDRGIAMGRFHDAANVVFDQGVISLPSNTVNGEWITLTRTYTPSRDAKSFVMWFRMPRNGSLYVRKPSVYKGSINKSIWSASPFDIDRINNITTVTNLLRGTRDFSQGTILSQNLPNWYENGFNVPLTSEYVRTEVDSDGFTVGIMSKEGLTTDRLTSIPASVISGVKTGEKYTLSCDLLIEDFSKYDDKSAVFYIAVYDAIENKSALASDIGNIAYTRGVTGSMKDNTWTPFVFHFTIPELLTSDTGRLVIQCRTRKNGTVKYKKLNVNRGYIEHPEWIANPFDITSSYDWNNGSPQLLGTVKQIPSGADLNDYKEAGSYALHGDSLASTIKNIPTGGEGSFKLDVVYTTGYNADYIRQVFTRYTEAAPQWIRYKQENINGGNWTPWRQTYANTTVRPIEGGGTNSNTISGAQTNLRMFRPIEMTAVTDLNEAPLGFSVWGSRGGTFSLNRPFDHIKYGLAWTFSNGSTIEDIGKSGNWVFQMAMPCDSDIRNKDNLYYRQTTNTSGYKKWHRVVTMDDIPYNSGLYEGEALAYKFVQEIGDEHIATWLKSRVSQGNFDGFNIGDYVDIICTGETRRYIIAAIDPYYNCGSPTRMNHHIVMVPSRVWKLSSSLDGSYFTASGQIVWSTTGHNNGTSEEQSPYLVSNLHKWESEVAIKQFPKEWQDVMIDRIAYIETRYSASSTLTESTGRKWCNLGKLWSLSEVEISGRNCMANNGANMADTQFPIFSLISKVNALSSISGFWNRDVASQNSTSACMFAGVGAHTYAQTNSQTVFAYPCFLIG